MGNVHQVTMIKVFHKKLIFNLTKLINFKMTLNLIKKLIQKKKQTIIQKVKFSGNNQNTLYLNMKKTLIWSVVLISGQF